MAHYFATRIFFNLLNWTYIGLGFIIIAILAETPGPIVGIGGTLNLSFIYSTALGIMLMFVCSFLTSRALIKLRKRYFSKGRSKDVISDAEAARMFANEIISQLNSMANLALVIFLMHKLDKFLGQKLFANPAVDLDGLLWVSGIFYLIGFLVHFSAEPHEPHEAPPH